MKRLTERFSNGQAAVAGCGSQCQHGFIYCENIPDENRCSREWSLCPAIDEILEKLAEYEDAEEQGLLYRKIFFIEDYCHKPSDCPLICEDCFDNYLEVKDRVVEINRIHIYGEIGKTVFFTKEEAEQALERMKKNE